MHRLNIYIFLLSLLLNAPVFAQEEQVTIHFQTLAWNKATRWTKIYFRDGEQFRKLQMPLRVRSPEYTYVGPPELNFYSRSEDSSGAPIWKSVTSLNVDPNQRDWLFLMQAKEVKNEIELRVVPIPDDGSGFSFGSYRVFNFSGRELLAKVGEEIQTISNMTYHTFDGIKNDDLIEFGLGDRRENDQWDVTYNSAWRYDPRRRTLVLVTEDPEREGEVKLKLIHEYQSTN